MLSEEALAGLGPNIELKLDDKLCGWRDVSARYNSFVHEQVISGGLKMCLAQPSI